MLPLTLSRAVRLIGAVGAVLWVMSLVDGHDATARRAPAPPKPRCAVHRPPRLPAERGPSAIVGYLSASGGPGVPGCNRSAVVPNFAVAGTVTISDPTGAVVARRRVAAHHVFHIPLPPGTYAVTATERGTIHATPPATVTATCGRTTARHPYDQRPGPVKVVKNRRARVLCTVPIP
jgi:hypothetical protein